MLPGLRDKYIKAGQVRVIFAYFPTEGPKAAVAGVCAARQGKFWEFADALFALGAGGLCGCGCRCGGCISGCWVGIRLGHIKS